MLPISHPENSAAISASATGHLQGILSAVVASTPSTFEDYTVKPMLSVTSLSLAEPQPHINNINKYSKHSSKLYGSLHNGLMAFVVTGLLKALSVLLPAWGRSRPQVVPIKARFHSRSSRSYSQCASSWSEFPATVDIWISMRRRRQFMKMI